MQRFFILSLMSMICLVPWLAVGAQTTSNSQSLLGKYRQQQAALEKSRPTVQKDLETGTDGGGEVRCYKSGDDALYVLSVGLSNQYIVRKYYTVKSKVVMFSQTIRFLNYSEGAGKASAAVPTTDKNSAVLVDSEFVKGHPDDYAMMTEDVRLLGGLLRSREEMPAVKARRDFYLIKSTAAQ